MFLGSSRVRVAETGFDLRVAEKVS